MRNSVIGHVVGVHGPRIKVELEDTVRSPVRAGLDGARTIVAINSYLTFELGAGEVALGVVTDLEARERWDPADGDLTLELIKPRRVATLQLLGTVRGRANSYAFNAGITVLPTLDTHAEVAASDILDAVFSKSPRRNVPPSEDPSEHDGELLVGEPVAAEGVNVVGSFNDLFSRPVAVVGNTGSGKSCTIAHLLQEGERHSTLNRPHFFILDINGEYGAAFGYEIEARPNEMYVNGRPFGVPIWLMNAREVCEWLSASEQTQEPVLKNVWSMAKGNAGETGLGFSDAQEAIERLNAICENLRKATYKTVERCRSAWLSVRAFTNAINDQAVSEAANAINLIIIANKFNKDDTGLGIYEKTLLDAMESLRAALLSSIGESDAERQESADKPMPFPISMLNDPSSLFKAASTGDDDRSIDQFLKGLRLRLKNRLLDRNCSPSWFSGGD
jgi:hypothetical protein